MRYTVAFIGTIDVTPAVSPDDAAPVVTPVDAGLIFDPTWDRRQVDATTDEFRLTFAPGGGPTTAPSVAKILAFPAGSVPTDSTVEAVLAMAATAGIETPVSGFGSTVLTLTGLTPGESYDAVILPGFAEGADSDIV